MSSKHFWSLTWYEWGLWCLRIIELRKKVKEEHEFKTELTRQFMTLFAKANGWKEAEPQNFLWPLSYDKTVKEAFPQDEEEIKDKVKRLELIAKNRQKRG